MILRIIFLTVILTIHGTIIDDSLTETECTATNIQRDQENAVILQRAYQMFQTCADNEKRKFLKTICPKVAGIYGPFGLTNEMVFKQDLIQNSCNVPEPETIPPVNVNKDLKTVMLVGQTGAGKSFLGNALFGQRNPAIGPFSTGHALSSTTKFVKTVEASYFGARAAKFGIQPFNLNIVDSPGFEDSSQVNAEKNEQRISAAFDFGVNSIILVIGRAELKLSQTEQRIFTKLHNWTKGKFWKHLTILLRVSFNKNDLYRRAENDQSFWTMYSRPGYAEQFLVDHAQQNGWTMDGGSRLLQHDDIDLSIIPFDAAQTQFCDKNSPVFDLCSEMPIWEPDAPTSERQFDASNDDDDYHRIVRNSYEYEPNWYPQDNPSKEYFFIEGAKNLANRIQNSNAIIPSPKQEYRDELKNENEEYKTKFIDNDQHALPNCLALMNDEKSKVQTLYSCPTWSSWSNDGGCSKLCNRGSQRQTRTCVNGSTNKPIRLCETSTERASKTINCNTRTCPSWNAWGSYTSCSPTTNCRVNGSGNCPSRTRRRSFNWGSLGERYWKQEISQTGLRIPGVSSTTDQSETDLTGCNCQACAKEWGSWGGEYCAGSGNCHRDRSRTCYNLDNYYSNGNAYRNGDRLGTTSGCVGSSTTRVSHWSSRCGWGCGHKLSDKIFNRWG